MKIAFKIFKIFAILIFTVSVTLFAASKLLQEKVSGIILNSLNQNISTKLKVGSFRLSFFSKFPKASLELKNVLVHSSPGFNSAAFCGINTDTLLSARNVSVEFKITDIIRGNYTIERIRAKTGKLNIFTDTAGMVNYNITVKHKKTEGDEFTINLDKIYISDIKSYYNHLGSRLIIYGIINKGTLKSRIQGDNLGFLAKGELQIDSLHLYSARITKQMLTDIDINLQKTKSGLRFKKGNIHIENFDIGFDGSISNDNIYDMSFSGQNIDVTKIHNYLPDEYKKLVSEYSPSGILVINSKIKGLMSRRVNPHLEVNWKLSNGKIKHGKIDLAINNLSFTGFYTNGIRNCPATGSLIIKDIKAKLGSAEYKGSFSISRLDQPVAELLLRGKLFIGEVREFLDLQNISEAGGNIDFDLKMAGYLDKFKKFEFSSIPDLRTEASLTFNSFKLGLKSNSFLVQDVNGNLLVSNTIQAKNLRFNYKGQNIGINGEFRNLLQWLDGRPILLGANADVSFSRLIPGAFLKESDSSEKSSLRKTAFNLPDDMVLDINFKIDSLTYKTFSSTNISGTLNYKPKLLTFKSFNMKALKGSIKGNGFVLQNYNKSVLSKGIFNVSNVDVNKAFTAFQNFGQTFLIAENIAGTLSGSFSLLLPLDSLLHPQIRNLAAEGKYSLSNGGLINFEPVKQLSSFIELSELENISFAQMENDFFIRNNYLYTPQMQVRSSAVDLYVNGKHSLDNEYEYHVKVLLSEILSKKRNKNKKNVTEFGVVEDDGLGRTSMLLKVVGKGEEVKVSYDIKAAANEIKKSINTEKKTLKSILNQEYGWFKNDTANMKKPVEKKHKFKVQWDDK